MPPRIESLESRTFLSASSLFTDEAALTSSITSLTGTATADGTTIRNDVAGFHSTAHDKALGTAWAKGVVAKFKVLEKANTTGQAAVNKAVATLAGAPASRVIADAAKLQSAAGKALAAIDKASNALHAADVNGLNKIAAAFPTDTQLHTDIATIESNGATHIATIQTDASTVFATDVGDLIASD